MSPRRPAMTRTEIKPAVSAVKELLAQEPDALREIVRSVMQAMLEAEMDEALGAGKSERSDARLGYRSGHYPRTLVTRVGKLELRVPQDRAGRFSTELRSEEHTSELQSLMRISYAVFCLKKKNKHLATTPQTQQHVLYKLHHVTIVIVYRNKDNTHTQGNTTKTK